MLAAKENQRGGNAKEFSSRNGDGLYVFFRILRSVARQAA
jgi:hypothetical protein